jgi:hypothetical protein
MKNISTGFGLCVAAATALAYPFVSSLAPNANASTVTAVTAAVTGAATAQTGPTIVWYGALHGPYNITVVRAWSSGRLEAMSGNLYGPSGAACQWDSTTCGQWVVISDPAQGLTYRSDINFDEKVDGADLGALLADWGDAPRRDIPPSDCPLNLVNP